MQSYRLYFMDKRTGHISRFEVVEAATDVAAVEQAERQVGSQPMELWRSGVKVRRFEPAFADYPVRPAAGIQQPVAG